MKNPVIEEITGIGLEVVRQGNGRRVLFLHPHIGMYRTQPFVDALAEGAEVLAPSHPGFGRSVLPKGMTTVEDLSYYYLEMLDRLDWREVTLVGASLGGWIASAMAVKNTSRIATLVLVDTLGAKFGAGRSGDFVDFFSTPRARLEELYYHDAALARRDIPDLSDEDRALIARNWDATAMYGWNPCLHDPKLRGRLYRIHIPALVIWGESDAIVPTLYGKAFSEALPKGVFETIAGAGHFPHIEKPAELAHRILDFANANVPDNSAFRVKA